MRSRDHTDIDYVYYVRADLKALEFIGNKHHSRINGFTYKHSAVYINTDWPTSVSQ